MTDKSKDKVGYLNTILAQGGGNLNDPFFKSSNAQSFPGAGKMLKFRFHICIKECTETENDFVFSYYEAPLKVKKSEFNLIQIRIIIHL